MKRRLGALLGLPLLLSACAGALVAGCTAEQVNATLDDVCTAYQGDYARVSASTDATDQNLVTYANSICDPTTGKPLATAPTDGDTVSWGTAILTGLKIALPYVLPLLGL